MTNAELLAKIKAEIERRIKECEATYPKDKGGYWFPEQEEAYAIAEEYKQLLSFLDTLESGTTYDTQQYAPIPSVSIEDVARVQFASHAKVIDKKRKAIFDWEQFKEVAGIFYGFGKKDSSDTLESEKPVPKGLEEAAEEKYPVYWKNYPKDGIARSESSYDTNKQCRDAFIAGAKWDRSQMMEEAVEGEVCIPNVWVEHKEGKELVVRAEISKELGFKFGDKVRIIIVKEDEK